MAQIDDRLGRALGRHHVRRTVHCLPDVRHGTQLRRQPVFMQQRPVAVQMLSVFQEMLAQSVEGFFHWIKRVGLAGQNGELDEGMKRFGQFRRGGVVNGQTVAFGVAGTLGIKLHHGHAVFSQRAGLVHAQH